MAQARLSMRSIREIPRLKAEGVPDRQIAASVGCARSTLCECLTRARAAGIAWPLPEELDEAALITRLYPGTALKRHVEELPRAGFRRGCPRAHAQARHAPATMARVSGALPQGTRLHRLLRALPALARHDGS